MKHGCDKQRKWSCEYGPNKCLGRNCAGCIGSKCIDEVVECSLEYREESEAHEDEAEAWGYPAYGSGGCPAKYEEACSKEYAANHHWRKACFGYRLIVVGFKFAGVEFVIAKNCRSGGLVLGKSWGIYRIFAVPPKIVPTKRARKGSLYWRKWLVFFPASRPCL